MANTNTLKVYINNHNIDIKIPAIIVCANTIREAHELASIEYYNNNPYKGVDYFSRRYPIIKWEIIKGVFVTGSSKVLSVVR